MNILFVGNSYTFYNDMPEMFEKLANDNGKNVNVYSVTKGGRKLVDYETADETTAKLQEALDERRYDVCIIQEQSILPASDYDAFIRGLDGVIKMVKDRADRLVLYATWGRKRGSTVLDQHNWTTSSMTELLSHSYFKAAKIYGADISPVGENFLKLMKNSTDTELYNADLSHPSYDGSCLAALTHYYTLFGEFPENCDTLLIDSAKLSVFKSAVSGYSG